jgi:multidrug efflux pump
MQKLPGFQDVNSDAQNAGLQELLNYDRAHGRSASLPQSLDQSLSGAFGQSEVSIIYTQLNQYYVVLEVAPALLAEPRMD